MTLALCWLGVGIEAVDAQPQASELSAEESPSRVWEVGAFLGPRWFSRRSTLGVTAGSRASISGSVAIGGRFGYVVMPASELPGLTAEAELAMVLSSARNAETSTRLAVFDPRVQIRTEGAELGIARPFAVLGLGFPLVTTTTQYVLRDDVTMEIFAGGGVRFERESGWNLRVDARTIMLPARGVALATFELEIAASLYRRFGDPRRPERLSENQMPLDSDDDGVPDHRDQCPDRDEDRDDFEDDDGCPDIDDDSDEVLDIVDRCRLAAEVRNGYRDSDGCPDQVPEELRVLVADDTALVFASNSTALRASGRRALDSVAERLSRHRPVQILIVGHTDDREELQDTGDGGDLDQDESSADLGLRRAQSVRDYLLDLGIAASRIKVESGGSAYPVADNDDPRGRLRNRRVTIALWVPGIPTQWQLAPTWQEPHGDSPPSPWGPDEPANEDLPPQAPSEPPAAPQPDSQPGSLVPPRSASAQP